MNESNKKMLCSPNLSAQKPRVCVRIYCDVLEKIYAKPIPPSFPSKDIRNILLSLGTMYTYTVSTVFLGSTCKYYKKTDFL